MKFMNSSFLALTAMLIASLSSRSQAQMTVTAYGSTPCPNGPGLSLSTWGTGFSYVGGPNDGVGPIGILPLDKKVLVTIADGTLLAFPYDTPPVPGGSTPIQTQSDVQVVQLQHFGLSNAVGLGALYKPGVSPTFYMTQAILGQVVQIDPVTGAIINVAASGIPSPLGICGYPAHASAPGSAAHIGHLFVSSDPNGIVEVDPVAMTTTAISPTFVDGIVITPSGRYLMGANGSGLQVFDLTLSPPLSPVYTVPIAFGDGIALGGGNCLAGNAYVNTNDGKVWEVQYDTNPGNGPALELEPPVNPVVNLVASGGTRGDFIAVDIRMLCTGNAKRWPSMLMTQTDRIVRLDPPDGGWFGPPAEVEAVIDVNQSFCAGDGSLPTNCPCSNFGSPGSGCNNSSATGGALLSVTGSTTPDTMVLVSTGELPSVFSVFIQGRLSITNGSPYGDGVRCVNGSLKRLRYKNADHGQVTFPDPTTLSITERSAQLGDVITPGSSRYYQVMYRDPVATFCGVPTSTFNISSAIRIDW